MPPDAPLQTAWPGLQKGRLLLPLPPDWLPPDVGALSWDGISMPRKAEFHMTLLNEEAGWRLLGALGEREIRRHFEDQEWVVDHTGDGVLLRKDKAESAQVERCASLIELVEAPALKAFRRALGSAASIQLPDAPAHVTLHAGGDLAGIGVPDYGALQTAAVAALRLPAVTPRQAPPLPAGQRAAYCAAHYALDAFSTTVRIGQHCPFLDGELARRDVTRAAIVTAFNPFSTAATAAGNEVRQQWLLQDLARRGLQVVPAEGRDPDGIWSPEPSVLVFGTNRDIEDRLLWDYEQHALVVIEQGEPARLVLHPAPSADPEDHQKS